MAPRPDRTLDLKPFTDPEVDRALAVRRLRREVRALLGDRGAEFLSDLDVEPYEDAARSLVTFVGEDAWRDGLTDTPLRILKSLLEMTEGYGHDVEAILSTSFPVDLPGDAYATPYQGAVTMCNIEVVSLCEHHLLPFFGCAHVSYIPGDDGRVVGLSKLARVVDAFAKRLQVQERLTAQIAEALQRHLQPRAVAVMIDAEHLCMRVRGVGKQHAQTVTTELLGSYLDDPSARAEVLSTFRSATPRG